MKKLIALCMLFAFALIVCSPASAKHAVVKPPGISAQLHVAQVEVTNAVELTVTEYAVPAQWRVFSQPGKAFQPLLFATYSPNHNRNSLMSLSTFSQVCDRARDAVI